MPWKTTVKIKLALTLKWPMYFPPVDAQMGGSMGPQNKKTTFPAEFCDACYTIYFYTKKKYIHAKTSISGHFGFGEN